MSDVRGSKRVTEHTRPGGGSGYRESDDRTLALLVRDGDREACAALLERYRTSMWGAAFRITRDEDAADGVVSRFSVRFLQCGWGAAGVPDDVPAFLCKAVGRLALDVLRGQKRRSEREPKSSKIVHRSVRSPLADAADAEVRESVRAAMERLSPRQQKAFELVRLDGHSMKQSAEQMGISPKRVENLDAAARMRLRDELGPMYRDDLWDPIDPGDPPP